MHVGCGLIPKIDFAQFLSRQVKCYRSRMFSEKVSQPLLARRRRLCGQTDDSANDEGGGE